MTWRDWSLYDRRVPPHLSVDETGADIRHTNRELAQAQPWWSQVRLMRKPDAASLRSRHRRRGASPGDAPPPMAPRRIPAPRRIGGSLLLAVGYSLAVWAAFFLIVNALGNVI